MGTYRTPLLATENPSPNVSAGTPSECSRLRILVVDDFPDAAETLAFLLQMDGHDVRTATDGHEALDAARIFQPDAVVLDIGLPVMDGYQVAKQMRATDGAREARLVAVTGYAPCEVSAQAAAAGFDTILVKPVTLTRLRGALAGNRQPVDAVA